MRMNFTGRLSKDVEVKSITDKNGNPLSIADLRVIVDDYYNGQKHPLYIFVTAFGKRAEMLGEYGRKGRQLSFVNVHGYSRRYEKDGKTLYTPANDLDSMSMVLFDDTKDSFENNTASNANNTASYANNSAKPQEKHLSTDEKLKQATQKCVDKAKEIQHQKAEAIKQGEDPNLDSLEETDNGMQADLAEFYKASTATK